MKELIKIASVFWMFCSKKNFLRTFNQNNRLVFWNDGWSQSKSSLVEGPSSRDKRQLAGFGLLLNRLLNLLDLEPMRPHPKNRRLLMLLIRLKLESNSFSLSRITLSQKPYQNNSFLGRKQELTNSLSEKLKIIKITYRLRATFILLIWLIEAINWYFN